jgi:hypothetical protein
MKKTLVLTLTLALTLALSLLTACGGSNNSPATSGSGGSGTDDPPTSQGNDATTSAVSSGGEATASLIAWMMDGTFSYDYTMTSEGSEGKTEGKGSMAVDGDKMGMATEMTVEGQNVKSRIIVKDGVTYIVDDVNKYIMKAQGGMNPTEGMMTDYSGIVKTGEGTGEINGKTLPYEEYAESDTGAIVRYYLDGGQVYGIESEYEGYKTVMIITNPSNSVPAGAFDLPEGYTDMESFGRTDGVSPEDYLPDDFEMPDVALPDGVTLPDGIKIP